MAKAVPLFRTGIAGGEAAPHGAAEDFITHLDVVAGCAPDRVVWHLAHLRRAEDAVLPLWGRQEGRQGRGVQPMYIVKNSQWRSCTKSTSDVLAHFRLVWRGDAD